MKPDWSTAPEWAGWCCMCRDGLWMWFEKEPTLVKDGRFYSKEGRTEYVVSKAAWINSIEKRPASGDMPIAMQHTWQAIETAPKDGTRVLICGGTYGNEDYDRFFIFEHVTIAFWHVKWGEGHWHGDELPGHDSWNWHEPKYWMPLPIPLMEASDDE